ncbi:MAG: universal stress protein [Rhizobiales bacterium]|nr:universal stress protein [Hyphomicrobiales bacterium]
MKSILVHLDHEDCSVRLGVARRLAEEHGARIVGLFAERAKAAVVGAVATWPSEAYVTAAAESRAAFEAGVAGLPKTEWRDANRGGEAEVVKAVVNAAHGVDLVILGKDSGGSVHSAVPAGLAEKVLVESGRPCLIVPNETPVPHLGQWPLVAWNGSRESVRALTCAFPLMRGAREAVMLTVGEIDPQVEADCVTRFADYGVPVRTEHMTPGDIGLIDLLLARAVDNGCDLMVMGAHEAGPLAWFGRGSATQHVLANTTLPVLMSR